MGHNKLRDVFLPPPDKITMWADLAKEYHDEQKIKKGCVTCKNKIHVCSYPGVSTSEEFECTAGYECDTITHTVINCHEWVEADWVEGEWFK